MSYHESPFCGVNGRVFSYGHYLDIVSDVLDHLFLGLGIDNVVGTIGLVCGNKIGDVDRRKGLDFLHVRDQLTLKVPLEDFSPLHSLSQIGVINVPSADDKVVGFNLIPKIVSIE